MPSAIQFVVGLGNPGAEYAATRHNAGAWGVESLAASAHATLSPEKKFMGQYAKIKSNGSTIHFLIPSTFMNNSGQAVQAVQHFYKIPTEAILVLHDELDLPPGQVKLKHSGGHAGHNGLRSIIQHIGSANFWRLRIGIGHPGDRDKVTPFVLGTPSKTERKQIDDALYSALRVVDDCFAGDFEQAMRHLHTKE